MGGWAWALLWVWAWLVGTCVGVGPGSGAGASGKTSVVKLAEEEDCKDDIHAICKDDLRSNFAVLECLQNERVSGSRSGVG